MDKSITIEKIKWMALDNEDATRTLKQHGYVRKIKNRPYSDETYEGNAQLCKPRRYCSEDGEGAMPFDDIKEFSSTPHKNACKNCLRIYNSLTSK